MNNTLILKDFKKINLVTKKANMINLLCQDQIIIITSSLNMINILRKKKTDFKISSLKNTLTLKLFRDKENEFTNQFLGSLKYISIKTKKNDFKDLQNIVKILLKEENIYTWAVIWNKTIYPVNRLKQISSIQTKNNYNYMNLITNKKSLLKNTLIFSKTNNL